MCGFCGIAYVPSSNQTIDAGFLSRMTSTLAHRGPDGDGFWIQETVGLGHRRLAVIDLAGGAQPMTSAEGDLHLVYNGEIYNFLELEEELKRRGCQIRTRCDTEVILHAYRVYGEDCVTKFRGMFSFALWDSRRQRLMLARDRLGKKPLVYAKIPNGIVFGSELKALLEHPHVSREIDAEALDLYLTYQYIPSPHTVFKSIRKLPPAHIAIWEKGELTVRRYWSASYEPKSAIGAEEAKTELMRALRESVRLRLISDVPLGAFLSGGIDSAAVVGLMSELSSQPVKTYTIGFEETEHSELPAARVIAKRFGTDHHECVVRPDAAEILPKLAWHYGEPFGDPSTLPTYCVARETRKEVTVALTGDGGDENFAGYYRYPAMAFFKRWNALPRPLRAALARAASAFSGNAGATSWPNTVRQLLAMGDQTLDQQYLGLVNVFEEDQKQRLYSDSFRAATRAFNAPSYLVEALSRTPGGAIDRYLSADLTTYLPECLMTKMDIASMACSLEVRAPLLDHHVVEWAARLPEAFKWRPLLQTKWILREALKGWVPPDILSGKKKGFGLPLAAWMRGKWRAFVEETLSSERALRRGYFRPKEIRRLLSEHAAGQADHSHRLWTLVMLELWHHAYVDRTVTPS
jgi:asparagine synthase (glutamine-hydrolysing)